MRFVSALWSTFLLNLSSEEGCFSSKKALFLLFYEHHCTFILTLLLGTSLHCVYMHELYKALQVCSFMPDFYSTISAEHNVAKTFVKSQYDS